MLGLRLYSQHRARLRRWAARLAPFNSRDAWRGQASRLPSRVPCGALFPGSPLARVAAAAVGPGLNWHLCRAGWATWLPAKAELGGWPVARVRELAGRWLRGLGGLHCLKMRYKGKSFK